MLKGEDAVFEQTRIDFNKRLQSHNETQKVLWDYYKEIDDLILPDETVDLYSGIQGRIMNVLKVDIDDSSEPEIGKQKL